MVQSVKTVIGRVEKVKFPELGVVLHARIDTGAQTSSVGVVSAVESKKGLEVIFAGDSADTTVTKTFRHYERVVVASSMGHLQTRYKVILPIVMRGRRIRATFTLADRSTQVYPVLIGRRALNRKFIVDVSMGSPLKNIEQQRSEALQAKVIKEDKL
jgi:hypothetical protein